MNEFINTILFSNVINIFIVIAFFIWLFRRFDILSYITRKRDEIVEVLKNLEHERKIKKQHLETIRNKVKNVDEEVNRIIDQGEQVATSLSERIIEEAEKEAADMQKKAHYTIENERKMASNDIIQEITGSAFAMAQARVKESIDERMHRKYIDNFIDNLGELK